MYVYVNVKCICTCARICICTRACVYIYIYIFVHVYVHVYVHVKNMQMHMYMYKYTYVKFSKNIHKMNIYRGVQGAKVSGLSRLYRTSLAGLKSASLVPSCRRHFPFPKPHKIIPFFSTAICFPWLKM